MPPVICLINRRCHKGTNSEEDSENSLVSSEGEMSLCFIHALDTGHKECTLLQISHYKKKLRGHRIDSLSRISNLAGKGYFVLIHVAFTLRILMRFTAVDRFTAAFGSRCSRPHSARQRALQFVATVVRSILLHLAGDALYLEVHWPAYANVTTNLAHTIQTRREETPKTIKMFRCGWWCRGRHVNVPGS